MKIGLIGHKGRVAKRHLKAWRALGYNDIYGCGSKDDYKLFMDSQNLDVVDICTPIYLHARMIKYAVDNNIPVICEKPLALTLKDAEELCSLEGKVGIIYQFRFNPKVGKLKREIEEGKYGEIKMVTMNYFRWRGTEYYNKWEDDKMKAGGGVLFNVCIHYFDLAQWLFGYPTYISGIHNTSKIGLDVEDSAITMMKFPNGAIGSIVCSTHVNPPKHFEFSVYGTKGHTTIQLRQNEYHKQNIKAFLDGKDYVTPREAFKSYKMIYDIYHHTYS